jgi:hypothetical protein
MSDPESVAGGYVVAAVALVAAGAAGVLAALHAAYRRTVVRLLRDRHPQVWEQLGRPAPVAPLWGRSARRLAAFLRAGRHYGLNDADVAAAGRLCVVTGRAAMMAGMFGAMAVWLVSRT